MKHFLFFTAAIGGLFTLVHAACGSPFVLSSVVTNNLTDFFITIGDVNGDGKPDAVGLSQFGNTVTVATNAGNGIFFSNATYAVGSGPRAGAIADINGDGKPDLITANFSDNTVTVLTNAGGGIFVSNAACAVGNGPEFVLVTDINGDGKPDIITINNGDGTLTILTNAGGTFPVAQKVQVVNSNSAPMTFAVADINGDGKPDIIAGDVNDGLIEVLTNAGAGIFVSNAVYAAGSSGNGPEGVEAADFNKDGKMDVAAINKDGTVTVLTNAGNSVLVSSQTITLFSTPIIGRSGFAATADVDGDGYPDLLLDEIDGFTLTLFNSGSGGTFITNYLILTNTAINMGSFGIAAGDLNGDGKPDVVGTFPADLFLIFTNGIGSFPNIIAINIYSNINSAPVTNIIAQATSLSGAVVNFTTTATNWAGSWPVTNTPPSGSVFPIGTTMVTSSTAYFIKNNLPSGSTNVTFTVTVVDTNAPVITLLGANPATNFVDNYIDPGATATDPLYGNLTSSIIVSGNLNTNIPGTYTVTYSVTDPSGNNAMTNRTVVIIPLPSLGVASAVGHQTAIFWPPGSLTNYVLQMTTNLNSGNWVNATNSSPLMGVFVTNSLPAAFFRLQPQ